MNKLMLLFFGLIITLVSCDGRDRVYQSNKSVLEAHHLLNSFSEQIKFTPNEYTEIVTDTLLSNDFKVNIKYFSSEKDSVIKTYRSNEATITHHYKDFKARLTVAKNNAIIVDGVINKSLFSKFETTSFWDHAIMQFIWVDYTQTTTNKINLNVSFCAPEQNNCKDYTVIIHESGAIKIEELDLSKAIL
ncbi:MAG: DUF4738 domain-containing protein [Algibacter sp.]